MGAHTTPNHSPSLCRCSVQGKRMGYESLLADCYLGVLPREIEEGILLDKDHSCFAALLLLYQR
ncbi:hypothetical protein LguiA_035901 [Lonicera macranthoides]